MRTVFKSALVGFGGLAVGGGFLWLALRQFDGQQFAQILASFEVRYMLAAGGFYWLGMAIRCSRWQALLLQLRALSWCSVAEVLVVGYGANNLLPARLGEFVRAEVAKKRFGLSRSMLLGTILVERALDLLVVLGCLLGGIALGAATTDSSFAPAIKQIVIHGLVAILLIGLAVKLLSGRLRATRSLAQLRIVREFLSGISSLNARSASLACALSSLVWVCESCALWLTFKALHLELNVAQTMLLVGAASLSTLLPTAPGYIGSYQLVFVLAMGAFGIPETAGIVASFAIQLFLFGTVTVVALGLFFARFLLDWKQQIRPTPVLQQQEIAHG